MFSSLYIAAKSCGAHRAACPVKKRAFVPVKQVIGPVKPRSCGNHSAAVKHSSSKAVVKQQESGRKAGALVTAKSCGAIVQPSILYVLSHTGCDASPAHSTRVMSRKLPRGFCAHDQPTVRRVALS